MRLTRRQRRLPSDHHELTLQGPIIEVVISFENFSSNNSLHNNRFPLPQENNGYIPDDYLKGNFEQRLNDLLDKVADAQKFPRNMLALDVNNIIGSGNYGDVIVGHLNKKRCQVHVVSGKLFIYNCVG